MFCGPVHVALRPADTPAWETEYPSQVRDVTEFRHEGVRVGRGRSEWDELIRESGEERTRHDSYRWSVCSNCSKVRRWWAAMLLRMLESRPGLRGT